MAAKKPVFVPTDADVGAFVAALTNDQRREDAQDLVELMGSITGEPPVLWGPTIIGFGTYHYVYESGSEGDSPVAAFAPRADSLVVYLINGFQERYADLLARLGPHKATKVCLYIKRLSDVDLEVLAELIDRSMRVSRGIGKASA